MKNKLFHNASLKLTAIYLSILMFISLIFSIGLYSISSQEIERGIRLQGPAGQLLRTSRGENLLHDLQEEYEDAVHEAKSRIRSSLVLINLSILVGGGLLCYYLAKRTLAPIEQAHEAQSRFTADASHELRTPITAMRVETELTLTEDKLTLKKAKDQLKSNIEELDKLTELSEGLLQLAHFDENGLEKSSTSLKHILQQAVENATVKAHKKKQTIKVGNIPESEIHANQAAIVQVLTIFLDNAIKYSPEDSTINVSSEVQKSGVHISVKDRGIGIKAGELPHVFDRFYRADSSRSKERATGYGIGLSIAKAIVDLHDGKITVKSTPNKGTTFTITLPS